MSDTRKSPTASQIRRNDHRRSESKGHVAVFQTAMEIGGIERVLLNLIQELDDRGYTVDLVLTRSEGEFLSEVPDAVSIVDLDPTAVPGVGVFSAVPSLIRYLRRAEPEALLSGKPHTNLVALIASRLSGVEIRTILGLNAMLSHHLETTDTLKYRTIILLSKYLYRFADEIVVASEGSKMDAATVLEMPMDTMRVIHNPVVTPRLLERADEPLDHPWFSDDAPPVVLSVGRLHPHKDYANLIRAFARVRATRDAKLVIIGEGDRRDQLTALVEELGLEDDVSLPGSETNPYPYMRRASVFALSSITEALPLALIEAMACTCPVIATDCSSGPVEILDGGRVGPLVPPNDPDALAEAIIDTLDDPPDEAILRERAMDFSVATIADEYEQALFPE
ncbi:glycosyltransferase [Natrinema amylolyticum]|uniref:glycosyltransferase n=1 Tax=Natrinema amylolyticum TaxID=2878679 RepID=UPI001CFBB97A|nr:glycosyltransferase [Natrinema amylolyticum]